MKIIWHGTASVEIQNNIGRIITDPFVPLKGSDVAVTIEEFDGFTDILITHGHIDHILSIPEIVKRNPEVRVWCTDTPYRVLNEKGVPQHNLRKIGYEEELELNGFRILTHHGRHAILPTANPRLVASILFNRNIGNLPLIARENSICVENDETVFYEIHCTESARSDTGSDHSDADSGVPAVEKTIALMGSMNLRENVDYPLNSDLLILPYNGWSDNLTPALAVIDRLKPKSILLDHYDVTFPPISAYVDVAPVLEHCPKSIVIKAMRLHEPVEL